MRIKLITGLILFVTIILTAASFVLYRYFEKTVIEETELRLMECSDDYLISIARNPMQFIRHPEQFLTLPSKSTFATSDLLVQFMDAEGKLMAKSPRLKNDLLAFSKEDDEVIKDIELDDGSKLKVYQRIIELEGKKLGYVIVGIPTSHIYKSFDNLRKILTGVMLCTIVILVLGVTVLASVNAVANQRKFLSFASHELRTPLSVISGQAEVALKDELSPMEYREVLKTILEESTWMNRLVSNFMLIFRSWTGMEKINRRKFNLGEMIVEAASAVKKRYPTRDIQIKISPDSEYNGDIDQIKKVIDNLLDNAAKNTKDGGRILVKLDSQPSRIVLEVSDDGIGIEKKLQKKIFDAFYRVEKGAEEGMGLGLAIAKWVVESHGGRIKVDSEPGKGAKFTVSLPKS